jgi:WD40 repeat protein
VIGTFTNKLIMMDRKSNNVKELKKVHLSSISQVEFKSNDSNYLMSSARKDNMVYLWDIRKEDSFVSYYERSNN